jgi:hypothetical protein
VIVSKVLISHLFSDWLFSLTYNVGLGCGFPETDFSSTKQMQCPVGYRSSNERSEKEPGCWEHVRVPFNLNIPFSLLALFISIAVPSFFSSIVGSFLIIYFAVCSS